jgi:hypothetical protein
MKLMHGVRVRAVALLKSERDVPYHIDDGVLRFTVPSVGDYEIAAVTVA